MNETGKSMGILQLAFIIIMSVGLNNHVLLIPFILTSAKRDAWISVIAAGGLAVLWLPLLYYIIKVINRVHLKDWLESTFGRIMGWIVLLPLLFSQFVVTAVTFQDTTRWTDSSYLIKTPEMVIALCIILLCFFAAQGGINSIAICAGFFLPFVVLLGYFVMGANFQYKDYSRLTPSFVDGYAPMVRGMIYAGSGFVEMILLVLLQHHAKRSIKFSHLLLLLVVIIGITVGPITGAIASFGAAEASIQRYPTFEQWKLVRFGNYIEHMDFFSIFQWLSGSFIRISLGLFIILDMLKLRTANRKNAVMLILCILLLGMFLVPFSDVQFDEWLISYLFPSYLMLLLLLCAVLVILAGIAVRRTRRGHIS